MIPSSSRSSAGLSDNRSRCASSSSEETKDTSALISSANEYLADVIADLTQQSTLVTLERRKSYWRILRASKHLSMVKSTLVAIDAKSRSNAKSVIENQSVSTEVLPTGPLSVSENSTKRAELSDSKNVMTESLSIGSPLLVTELSKTVVGSVFAEIRSLLVMDPVVKTEFQVIAQNVLAATERTPIPVDTHATNSTSAEIRTASKLADASTIPSDAHKVSLLPQPVIAITPAEPGLTSAKVSSQPDGSIKSCVEDSSRQIASEALTIVAEIQSDESIAAKIEDEKELNKRKVVNEVVEDFSRRMGSISMETNMQQWLVISRSYWAALRESKREPVDPVEVPVVEAPMTYFSSNQIQGNSSNLGGLSARTGSSVNATVEVDLSSDRMHMSGFAGIAKKLPSMHPADVTLTLWGLDKFELWPTQLVATNPSYTYEDNPLPGWSKNICVRMGGKLQGSLEITYCPPERTRRLRNRIEILAYLTKYNLSTYLTSRFDFRSVFCVCHTPEDSGSYLECSFGRAGCNRWLHSHCVGLGKRKEGELRDMATVICPLCTQYLESIGASDYMKNKTCLRKITMTMPPPTSVMVNGFEVFESSKPHTMWGLALPLSHSLPLQDKDKEKDRNGAAIYPRSHHATSSSSSSSSSSNSSSSSSSSSGNSSNSQRGTGSDTTTNIRLHPVEQASHSLLKTGSAVKPALSGPSLYVSAVTDGSTLKVVPHTAVTVEGVHSTDTTAPIPAHTTITELSALPRGLTLQVPTLPAPVIVPNPPPERSPVGAKSKTATPKPLSEDPFLSQLFMHRLFQGASTAGPETAPEESNNSTVQVDRDPGSGFGSGSGAGPVSIQLEDINLDLKYPVVEYSDSVAPRDRVRWAEWRSSAGDSLSTSSSPSVPSSSSARSFVGVRVTGGWMKAKDQSLIPASTRNAYGPSTTAVPPTVNLIEERVRRRAALDSTLQPSERGLGSRYRRQLLEAVTNSAYSTAHKKRTPGSEGRQAVEYHNQSMDAPLLFYLPSDGGLSATCITCAPKPLSLSSLCADNEMCAFCLNPFEPTMKLLSPAYIAGMQRRRDKDKKSRAAKRRKLSGDSYTPDSDFESDVFKSAKYLVSKTVGTVSYALHQQCAFAVDNGGLAGIAALALKAKQQSQYQDAEQFPHHHSSVSPSASPRSRSISSHTQSHSHSHSESSTDRVFKGIDLGDFYECDETDDAECDLCGRAGGIMQFFDLDSNFSSLPPPGEEGWLGHVPCISWLVSSKLLELPPSFLCKRGFLTGEISAVNFNSHSPLKRSDSKDYATDSPIVNGYLELNRSTSCTADMRAEEAEGSNESEMDAEQRRDEAAATSIYDNTCNDSRRRETVENAMLSSGGEMSADDVESSTASSCLYQTATDGVCVSEELTREHSLLPPELTITADKDSEAGDISTTNMHDTSPNVTVTATATATASSLKRASPDTSDQQPHQDHHKKGTPKSSPSLKRPKTSSTTDNRIHSAEKPSGDSIDYWSAGNNTQDKSDKGSVISTLIQNRQESLMQESTLQSEMPIVSGGNLEVLTLQLDLVSAALPHPGTVPETANTSSQALHSSSSPSSSIQTSYAPFNPQAVDSFDPTGPYSPTGQTRDTARMQPSHSESERVGSSSRRDQPDERPLSLFDSLVGQWRCSCCGTYAGVVLKCSAVACTVRAHPLCVSIAGSKWTAFEASSSSLDLNQSGHASQTALGFLCALHSPQGGE